MSRVAPLLLALLISSGLAALVRAEQEPLSSKDVEAIKKTRQAYVAACLLGDWDAAIRQWTTDGVRMVRDGQTEQGHEALRKHFDVVDRILKWDEVWDDVQVSGTMAYSRTHASVTAKAKTTAEPFSYMGKSLTVYRKGPDGRWLIAVDCYNSDAPAAR